MLSILTGIVIGVILALPPGPAAVTAIKLGLSNSSRHGILSGIGTAVMDFIYCIIAVFAVSAVVDWATNFSNNHPFISLSVQIIIVISIILYGFSHLRAGKVGFNPASQQRARFSLEKLSERGPFFIGIAIALANIANPTFLPSLGYVALHIQKLGLVKVTAINNVLFSLGFGLGNLLWLSFLVKSFVVFKEKMSEDFISKIHKFAGVTLIGFGTFLGYRVLEITKWSEMLRFVFAF